MAFLCAHSGAGSAPALGDRVAYVIVKGIKGGLKSLPDSGSDLTIFRCCRI